MSFAVNETFGFSLSEDGTALCVISDHKVILLNHALEMVEWIDSGLTSPRGQELRARGCEFVPGTSELLVEYWNFTDQKVSWELKSALLFWDWTQRKVRGPFHARVFVLDTVPVSGTRAIVYHARPNWLHRYLLEEINLATDEPLWQTESKGFSGPQLVASNQHVIRVERWHPWPGDTSRRVEMPHAFHDATEPMRRPLVIERKDPEKRSLLNLDGRVVAWERHTGKPRWDYSIWPTLLHWPLLVSKDDKWFAVRTVRFKYWEDNQTPGWDDNRFVIFALDDTKRRLFRSQKFGSQEAITGFALSPDGKTLVVTTSRRLLIYDVKDKPTK
jgi:hypothetical protein